MGAVSALALSSACGGEPKVVGAPLAPAISGSSTLLSVGDYVVYRFAGTDVGSVTLREEVIAQDGAKVTIALHAERGDETREWIQVGPSSADARWNNAVDTIYVSRGGERRELPNPDNVTLGRLYDWILVSMDAGSSSGESAACEQPIGNARHACTCERKTLMLRQRRVQSEVSRCPGFAWQRGPARFTSEDGKVVWQSEIVETGHRH